ncbi:TPA: hypothetical protein U2D36_000816 [Streptococcus suis]|nr:hypothetical protein [Streptococcus suis]HEM6356434.1 hypothetical protein [Streptococcus suis]HEM6380568.1 hypothetical protein [Streptococcus suis]HEM6409788.1 hypothetical protein [Streptococcus suis]
MTRFKKDYVSILTDPFSAIEILEERKKEIKILNDKRNWCKNKFRWQCITQELEQLEKEYRILDDLI